MVVILQVIAAGGRDCLKLVVLKTWQFFARLFKGATEVVFGVVHPIAAEHGAEASFVESLVVGD